MAKFNFLQDKTTTQQLFIFIALVAFGLVIWLILSVFLKPAEITIDPELSSITKSLDPELNLSVLPLIEQKTQLTQQELNDFPIYLKYTSATNYEENRLEIILFTPSTPLDLAYFNQSSASAAIDNIESADQLSENLNNQL